MREFWSLVFIGALGLSVVGCAARPSAEHTPGVQPSSPAPAVSAERAAVLEAIDAVVTRETGQPVALVVQAASIRPPFAAVTAALSTESGDRIDFSAIPKYSAAVEAGAFDEQVLALLERTDAGWQVLEFEVGSTDFPGQEWARAHGAPEDIFEQ